jgi:hypothetical protein
MESEIHVLDAYDNYDEEILKLLKLKGEPEL